MNGVGQKNKFTCYYCNKTYENESSVGHTAVCGNVLVPCPNKCGSYVMRMDMSKHKAGCVNKVNYTEVPSKSTPDYGSTLSLNRRNGLNTSENNISSLKELLSTVSTKINSFEKGLQTNQSSGVNQQFDTIKSSQMKHKLEVEKVKYQNQIIIEWKKNVEFQLENLKQQSSQSQKSILQTETRLHMLLEKLKTIDALQIDVSFLIDSFYKEQQFTRGFTNELNSKIEAFKDLYTEENAAVSVLWNDQKNQTDNIMKELDTIKKTLDEQKAKLSNIVFDLRAVSQIASDAAERIEIQEREFTSLKKEVYQMKLDLEILEGLCTGPENIQTAGRLLWKLTDVTKKLENAKEMENLIKSPVFYTHVNGYKVRILLYLNGLKKWKDRYALISIHVLKGEYDLLLNWPCHIEGNITLRDLENITDPKSFTKTIVAKRQSGDEESEEPQESSSSYIFIPHTVLFKEKFIKNDTIFFDISFHNKQKLESNF